MNKFSKKTTWFVLGFGIWLLAGCAQTPVKPQQSQPPAYTRLERWVLIDTRSKTLVVMEGNRPIEIFPKIALGTSGAGVKFVRGDNKTPVGTFRVGWINDNSRFNRFFGLTYPNLDYAERGYRTGLIDAPTYWAIRAALAAGQTPPQNTPLGGAIGIHGVGRGDPVIHANFNWTSGCVALNNYQIERLARWVNVGTRVVIR